MRVQPYTLGYMANTTCVLIDTATLEAAVVDPSYDSRRILPELQQSGIRVTLILNTHGHFDHVVENAWYQRETGAPLAIHASDAPLLAALDEQATWFGVDAPEPSTPDRFLTDGEDVVIGESKIHVLHSPGHSPGSVCFVGDGFIITGDVLFAGSVGRADLPGGDAKALAATIRHVLLPLPDSTIVYCGHGPSTTIGRERATNSYFGRLT